MTLVGTSKCDPLSWVMECLGGTWEVFKFNVDLVYSNYIVSEEGVWDIFVWFELMRNFNRVWMINQISQSTWEQKRNRRHNLVIEFRLLCGLQCCSQKFLFVGASNFLVEFIIFVKVRGVGRLAFYKPEWQWCSE